MGFPRCSLPLGPQHGSLSRICVAFVVVAFVVAFVVVGFVVAFDVVFVVAFGLSLAPPCISASLCLDVSDVTDVSVVSVVSVVSGVSDVLPLFLSFLPPLGSFPWFTCHTRTLVVVLVCCNCCCCWYVVNMTTHCLYEGYINEYYSM